MEIIYTDAKPDNIKVIFVDKELEAAHEHYLNTKRDCLYKLQNMIDNYELPAIYRKWMTSIYNFIEEEK